MKRLVLVLALLSSSCAGACPRCIKGHTVLRHQEAYCYTVPFKISDDISIPIEQCEPARDVPVFVCDQYEVEREK